jgi:hypothetical protein
MLLFGTLCFIYKFPFNCDTCMHRVIYLLLCFWVLSGVDILANIMSESLNNSIQISNDFALCIKCQIPGGNLVACPQGQSYDKFLDAVHKRATYGDGDFPAIRFRLSPFSAADLIGKATWHLECYKDTVHAQKIVRAEKAFKRKLNEQLPFAEFEDNDKSNEMVKRPFTRSANTHYNEDRCLFCNEGKNKGELHEVQSMNVGRQIKEVVEKSNNREWQVRLQPLNPDDARAINVKYHLYCFVKHVQRAGSSEQATVSNDDAINKMSVNNEFCGILRSMLSDGSFQPMDIVRGMYEQLLESHSLGKKCTSQEVKAKIMHLMPGEVDFSRPFVNRPEKLCSSAAGIAAIQEAAKLIPNAEQDLAVIMKCATIVRRDILAGVEKKWAFRGSLTEEEQGKHVPFTLQMLMKWIIQGTCEGAQVRSNEIEKASMRLSKNTMYETKSDRQISYRAKDITRGFYHTQLSENEQVIAVAVKVHSYTRSKNLIEYLHRNGHCINYSRLLRIESALAKSVLDRMAAENGVYVPPQLKEGVPVFFAVDNIDFQEDTPDGKRTTHGTVIVVFQTSAEEQHKSNREPCHLASGDSFTSVSADSYLRQLRGTFVPPNSPKYCEFKVNTLQDVALQHSEMDRVWLMHRFIGRSNKELEKQPIPLWAGYNSLLSTDERLLTTVSTLPLLTAPANEYNTLIDVLKQTQFITTRVMGCDSKTVITLDMDLYIRAVKLQSMKPDMFKHFVFRVGEFHTVLCSLRALGSFIESSGIDDAWIQSDIYGPTTSRQILEGKHMKRAVDAHIITVQVLLDLMLDMFFDEKTELRCHLLSKCDEFVQSSSNTDLLSSQYDRLKLFFDNTIHPSLKAFVDDKSSQSNMFKFFSTYIDQVLALLNFIRASRQGLWLLHLSSLEELCSLFFSQNRLKYAQHIPEYIAKMHDIQTSDPLLWKTFLDGNFCVKKSCVPFTSIGVDHAIEHVNRSMKVMGGIRGLTQKPGALSRFFLIAPELARLSREAESLAGCSYTNRTKHHNLSNAAVCRQEKMIEKMKQFVRENNPLEVTGTEMFNFATKRVLPTETAKIVMQSIDAGSEAYQLFVKDRLIGDVSLWEKMKKLKGTGWTSINKTSKVHTKHETIELKETRSLFARLALAAVSRPDIDMAECIGTYEFSCVSRALFAADGSLLSCAAKCQLGTILCDLSPIAPIFDSGLSNVTAVVDAMVVVQELAATAKVETCADFAEQFVHAMHKRTHQYNTMHIIFDNYTVQNSLKQSTRDKRSSGQHSRAYICSDNTPIKVSVHNFLSNVSTKQSLTSYLARKLIVYYTPSQKNVVVSTHEGVICNHGDLSSLSSNHEEADTVIILHAIYAASHQRTIHILSPDTDVLVLAIRRLPQLGSDTCVIRARNKPVLLQPTYDALGENLAAALPGFHAFTGCDTVGRFYGKGKQTCWKVLQSSRPEILNAFINLGGNDDVDDKDFLFLEEYVVYTTTRARKQSCQRFGGTYSSKVRLKLKDYPLRLVPYVITSCERTTNV